MLGGVSAGTARSWDSGRLLQAAEALVCNLHEQKGRVESVGGRVGARGVEVGEGKPADSDKQGAGHKGHCSWWQSEPQGGCVRVGPGLMLGQRLVALGPEE